MNKMSGKGFIAAEPDARCELCGAVLVHDDDGWVCLSCGTRPQTEKSEALKREKTP